MLSKENWMRQTREEYERCDRTLDRRAKSCKASGILCGLTSLVSAAFAIGNAIRYGKNKGAQCTLKITEEQLVDKHTDYWYGVYTKAEKKDESPE